MIKVDQISRSFEKDGYLIQVIKDLSFQVEKGECLAVVGPNGIGKTTLFRILSTLILPDSGNFFYGDINGIQKPELIRQNFAWSSGSEGGFFERFSGLENLIFFGRLEGLSQSQIKQNIESFKNIEVVQELLKTKYYLCSTGMKQLLNVMRALMYDREVLLLDEPTRSLDQNISEIILSFLKDLKGKKTILYTTHRANELTLADQTLDLNEKGVKIVAAS